MDFAAHVFALRVVHCFMREAGIQRTIAGVSIGRYQINLVAHGLAHEPIERRVRSIFDHLANDLALTRYCSGYADFASIACAKTLAFTPMLVLFLSADEGFINLNFGLYLRPQTYRSTEVSNPIRCAAKLAAVPAGESPVSGGAQMPL